ncbi:MAG: autotransporter-associated beta strand repeat-containing protein [Luteolibacter sp.]
MKPKFFRSNLFTSLRFLTAPAIVLSFAGFAQGADQVYQDANVLNTWNTTDANWDSGTQWVDLNNAIFGGTGESVTVTTVQPAGIVFNSTGYTLTGGTITLGQTSTPITVNANAAIASVVAGSNGFLMGGTGVLTVSGVNTFTGASEIAGGTLKLGNAAALGAAASVKVDAGAMLDLAGFSTARPLTISGTGVGSFGAVYNSATTAATIGAVTLAADASISNAATTSTTTLLSTGTLSLAGNKLTISNGGIATTMQNIDSGNIDINNGGTLYYLNGGSFTNTTGTFTVNTGGRIDTRDSNNLAVTSTQTIALNGGTLSNGGISGNNGGGGGAYLANNITVDATNGGTISAVSSGFGLNMKLAGTLSGSGALNITNNGVELRGDTSGYTGSVSGTGGITFNPSATQTFNGLLTATTRNVSKTGTATTILTANNAYTGTTSVSGGTLVISGTPATTGATTVSGGGLLKLDYTTNNTSKLSTTPNFTLNNGGIEFVGNASAATSQGIKGLILSGSGLIKMTTAAGQTLAADFTANSGTLTRTNQALDVVVSGGGTAQLKIPGTTASTAKLGWVTYNGGFAGTDASNFIVPATTGTATVNQNDLSLWTSGTNQYVNTGAWTNSVGAGVVIDGFTFNAPVASNVVIGTGNTLTVNQGIIATSSVGAFASTISGGTLQGASGGTLEFLQNNSSSTLTVTSALASNSGSGLTKDGSGTLIISSDANAGLTGPVIVNGGELQALATTTAGAKTTLGSGAITVNTGATLRLKTGSTSNAISYANNITLAAGTLAFEDGVTTLGGTFATSGSGTSTLTGVYSGKTLTLAGATTLGSGTTLSVAGSSTTILNGTISGAGAISSSSALTIGGTTSSYTGSLTATTGTVTFANTATYSSTGNLTLSGGSLSVSGAATVGTFSNASATGTTTVNAGGTLSATTTSLAYATTVTTAGTFNAGAFSITPAGSTTLTGAGAVNATSFAVGNGTSTVTFSMTGSLTNSGLFNLASSGTLSTFNQSAGTVNLTSTTAGNIRIGGTNPGTYNITGGTFNATGTPTTIGYGNTGIFTIATGTANVAGITFGTGTSTAAGTLTLTSGVLNIGAGGITDGSTGANTMTINLNGGTVGARADWSSALPATLGAAVTFNTLDAVDGTTARNVTLSGILSGASGAIVKSGLGSLTLSGAEAFAGSTTVNAGTLNLDYSTSNTSKLSDTAALLLNGGTVNLTGGSHAETVLSTTLNGKATITRAGGSTAVINLNTITRTSGTLNLGAAGIATTDNLNNTSGILGTWATINGDWAVNSTNAADGPITAYTGYVDVNRFGGAISSAVSSNVRIIDAGSTGTVTVGAGTTDINSLLNNVTAGPSTVTVTGILRFGNGAGVYNPAAAGALTFTGGTLTAGTGADNTAGDLTLNNDSTVNDLTVASVIANNGTGLASVTKAGAGRVVLTGTNTATGGYNITAGTLQVGAAGVTGTLGTAAVVNNSSLIFSRIDATAINPAGVISGTGTVTYLGSGTSNQSPYLVDDANTYTGATTINNARAQVSNATGFGTGAVSVLSGGTIYSSAALTIANPLTIAGIGWSETTGHLGAIRTGAAVTFSGALTLSANARLGSSSTATFNGAVSAPGFTIQSGAPSADGGGSIGGVVAFGNTSAITSSNTTIDVQSGTFRYDTGSANGSNLFATGTTGGTIQAASGTTVSLYQTESNAYSTSRAFTMGPQITLNSATFTGGGSVGALSLRLLSSTGIVVNGSCTISEAGGTQYTQFFTIEGPITGTGDLNLSRATSVTRYLRLRGSQAGYTGNVTIPALNVTGGAVIIGNTTGWGSGNLTLSGNGSNVTVGDDTPVNYGFTSGNDLALGMTTGTFAPTGNITVGALAVLQVNNRTGSSLIFEPHGTVTVNGGTLGSVNTGGSSAFAPATNATWVFGGSAVSTVSANVQLNNSGATFQVADAVAGSGVDTTVSGVISGSNGFAKTGAGTLSLTGANTYTGNTTVTAGTLSLGTAYLADASTVSVASGAVLDLAFTGSDTVNKLILDGVQVSAGTYGAAGSGATNIDNVHFTGTGMLTVTTGGTPYQNWAQANGLTTGVNDGMSDDPDHDGRNNLSEFAFDGKPLSGANDGKIVSKVATVGGQPVLTLTLPVRTGTTFPDTGLDELVSDAKDGVIYHIQGSLDLSSFTGNFINVNEVTNPTDITAVQGTLPTDKPLDSGWSYRSFYIPDSNPALNTRLFIRAKVESAP